MKTETVTLELEPARDIVLEGLYNLRDLGGYKTVSGEVTRWRRVLRADSLHKLTPEARDELLALGLTTVIDLRHADELEQGPNVFADHPDVRYINVPLFAGMARAAANLVQPSNDATSSSGSNDTEASDAPPPGVTPSAAPDLEMLYKGALERCRDAFREALAVMAEPGEGAILFHCTAGKDRTGLIAALVLGALEVPEETIIEDYALTAERIEPLLEGLRAEAATKGHDPQWYDRLLTAEPATMRATLAYLAERYSGASGYLATLGLGEGWSAGLRERLIAP